ncbi:protein phosphatase inhibitor 2-like isoform X3 [Palaemon carinicauda]|uniref:protein phosphatase inhibitor 2-like isoform X3 n=1 Tax=Palaemon carinicauda TaxID=392227 RepID=UPI0035B5B5D3
MADNLHKQPRKGILKNSSSFEGNGRPRDKETKWDEMNILATLHPKDKDYGHMKIEEPKTPFSHYNEGDSGDENDGLDADLLAKKIQLGCSEPPKALIEVEPEIESDEDEDISPEEREKRQMFEMKRKKHYNEFYAVKLARKLMQNDEEEDDDEDDNGDAAEKGKKDGSMDMTEGENSRMAMLRAILGY